VVCRIGPSTSRRNLHHPLRAGQRCPLSTRRLGVQPAARMGLGAHEIDRVVRTAEQHRGPPPDAEVALFKRVPRFNGDVGVAETHLHAEPRCEPLLPDTGRQDQNRVGTARVVILGYAPQPVVEGPPP